MQLQITDNGVVSIQEVVHCSVCAHTNALGLIKPVSTVELIRRSGFTKTLRKLPNDSLCCKAVTNIGVVLIPVVCCINAPVCVPQLSRSTVQEHQGNCSSLICAEAIPNGFAVGIATAINGQITYACMTATNTEGLLVLQTVDHVHVIPGRSAVFIGIMEALTSTISTLEIHPVAIAKSCRFLDRPCARFEHSNRF